jgi:hypothetical protein
MRRLSSLGSSIVRVIHALFERNCRTEMCRRAPDKGVQPMTERVNGEPTFVCPDEDSLQAWTKSFSPGRLYTMGRLTRGDA